jgi:hypothetical protein
VHSSTHCRPVHPGCRTRGPGHGPSRSILQAGRRAVGRLFRRAGGPAPGQPPGPGCLARGVAGGSLSHSLTHSLALAPVRVVAGRRDSDSEASPGERSLTEQRLTHSARSHSFSASLRSSQGATPALPPRPALPPAPPPTLPAALGRRESRSARLRLWVLFARKVRASLSALTRSAYLLSTHS